MRDVPIELTDLPAKYHGLESTCAKAVLWRWVDAVAWVATRDMATVAMCAAYRRHIECNELYADIIEGACWHAASTRCAPGDMAKSRTDLLEALRNGLVHGHGEGKSGMQSIPPQDWFRADVRNGASSELVRDAVPVCNGVLIEREGLQRQFGLTVQRIGDGTLSDWIRSQFASDPERRRQKNEIKSVALADLRCSARQFDAAWTRATGDIYSDRREAGRPRKPRG